MCVAVYNLFCSLARLRIQTYGYTFFFLHCLHCMYWADCKLLYLMITSLFHATAILPTILYLCFPKSLVILIYFRDSSQVILYYFIKYSLKAYILSVKNTLVYHHSPFEGNVKDHHRRCIIVLLYVQNPCLLTYNCISCIGQVTFQI